MPLYNNVVFAREKAELILIYQQLRGQEEKDGERGHDQDHIARVRRWDECREHDEAGRHQGDHVGEEGVRLQKSYIIYV